MSATASQSASSSWRSSTPCVASSDSIASASSSSMAASSGVEVERELRRMWAEPDDVDLVGALVFDPGADQLLAEHASLRQELMVGFERLAERPRHLRDLSVRLLEQVVVGRRTRVETAFDPVDSGHQHRGEGEV